MQDTGRIFQISVSRGGVPKRRVEEAVVTARGINGDWQRDQRADGSPEQAVCLFAIEQIALLRAEGHRVFAGSTGENVTTEGVDWDEVTPGTRIVLGSSVVLEVTDYASPCWKNAQWFINGNFQRISQDTHPGSSRAYARVVQGGAIREGDVVHLIVGDAIERVLRRQPPAVRWPRDFQGPATK